MPSSPAFAAPPRAVSSLPCLRCELCGAPAFHLFTRKPCRIRISSNLRLQLLYNPHFCISLGSADSKRLTPAKLRPQTLCHQHFSSPCGSAENKRLVTPSESALPKIAPLNPVESALPKTQGVTEITFKLPLHTARCSLLSTSFDFQVSTFDLPLFQYNPRTFSRGLHEL
jgi:hypothetical protein